MSTRGAYGFRINGQDKVTYNHSDSYPAGLGHNILGFVAGTSEAELKQIAERIKLVEQDSKPTKKQIKEYAKFADLDVSSGSVEEWYCLLRNAQGDLSAYTGDTPIKHMIDNQDFLRDISCEWAYIINIDEDVVEIYTGFNDNADAKGRYASFKGDEGYYGVALRKTIPFAEVAKIPDIESYCDALEVTAYIIGDEKNMKYKIKSKGKIIAEFLHKSDRDFCMNALQEAYDDCEFEAVDE